MRCGRALGGGRRLASYLVASRVGELERQQQQYTAGFIELVDTMTVSGNLSIQG